MKTFLDGALLFPGLKAISAPGHSFFELKSQNETLLFWGDIMHVAEVQFPDPSVTIQFDVDPDKAKSQRIKAFADAAKKGYLVAAAHISFPGVARLRKDGMGYRWIPINYVNDAY